MAIGSDPVLSVAAMFAERDDRRRRDPGAAEQLQRRKEEELTAFNARPDTFQLIEEVVQNELNRIRRAFERGETELMIASFPSTFCADDGRAVLDAGAPPITDPTEEELARQAREPD